MAKRVLGGLGALIVLVAVSLYAVGRGCFGEHEGPGESAAQERPAPARDELASRERAAAEAIGVPRAKQVLFGDLHVHTTFSFDAFLISLPLAQGEGAHPPADACDFARFCSALDFWSINDHSEGITARHWQETRESIRQCNAATDPANPDTVAYLGWEWTQVGALPEEHYGHKNVVLRDLEDESVPARPIAAGGTVRRAGAILGAPALGIGWVALRAGGGRMHDFARYVDERRDLEVCASGVPVRELPPDCLETAETPRELFAKLDDWGSASLVIPHGTTWGFYTPPRSDWRKQLTAEMHDPERQTLFEIFSGHGNSEEYRAWREVGFDADGRATCPAPRPDYLPACWRAGEIIAERCLAAGGSAAECEARAEQARDHAAQALGQAHLTVPGARSADWLDAGQCRDCAQPAFNYRPLGSAQYVMALRNFDERDARGDPLRFRFGFMASSDNHFARPGTGYKQVHRLGFTESRDQVSVRARLGAVPPDTEPVPESKPFDRDDPSVSGFQLFELERQASYFMTGGLVAAHSTGRDRQSIWDAFLRREVYGTSGPRILLWFDLLNPPGTSGASAPMGSQVEMSANPIFQVRAVGSFEQQPGCPDYTLGALGADDVQRICKGECYNPSDRRRPIARIDVVRIRPQSRPGEPVAALVEDPWRSFPCEPDPAGCAVAFEDPDFAAGRRDVVYYVRAHEPPLPGVNAGGIRCESRDEEGRCVGPILCGQGQATDDCLAPHEPRAWSSPIFVDAPRPEPDA
jgi:hypothetical protein